MTFDYLSVEQARQRDGLRMVVVGGVPSGWGEAAKGILHTKGLEWAAVRLRYDSACLKDWVGELSAPVAIYRGEPPRAGWQQILLLAERLAPAPSLLPADPAERALALGISHELCSEAGLGWARRLQLVHASIENAGGFSKPVAKYLGKKYGYLPEMGATWGPRVVDLLGMLANRLRVQHAAGSHYYIGDRLTAVDIYSAAFAAMFSPLPPEQCKMEPEIRTAFETLDARTRAALDPIILQHRDMMYARHLALPLSL